MGEITIQVPTRTKRRYIVADRKLAAQLLGTLEASAVRIDPISLAEQEDAADLESVQRAVAEFAKSGKIRSLKEFKAELGL